jgi:hypothetical protein
MGDKFSVPCYLTQYAGSITGIYPKIGNLIEHDLIFEKFTTLGFDRSQFLGYLSPPADYQRMASIVSNSVHWEEVAFSWWCLEYFRHWVSARHWTGDEPGIYADYALYWGSRAHPELKTTARRIRAFIESGALSDRDHHHQHVNELLRLMKIPVLTEWVTIKARTEGKPRVVRLVQHRAVGK